MKGVIARAATYTVAAILVAAALYATPPLPDRKPAEELLGARQQGVATDPVATLRERTDTLASGESLRSIFARGGVSELLRIQPGNIRRVGFLPSGRIIRKHGDGNLRRRLPMKLVYSRRIYDRLESIARREYPRSDQLVSLGDINDLAHTSRAIFRRDSCAAIEMSPGSIRGRRRKFARFRHRQQIRIAFLHSGQLLSRLNGATKTVVVRLVGGRSRSLAVDHRSH